MIPGIKYCGGWSDHANMGISVIGVYEIHTDCYRVFCADNFDGFKALVDGSDAVIGFNNGGFDDKLVAATLGWEIPAEKSYDLLSGVWVAHGLGRRFAGREYAGYGLDDCARANDLPGKSGNGALAPVLWQQGKVGQVIDYCLRDVWLTHQLIKKVMDGTFRSPKTGQVVPVKLPPRG